MENKLNKTNKFIEKAKLFFLNKYDYSLINYIDSKTKIEIKCVEHNNLFMQVPSEHLRGKLGCNLCHKIKITDTIGFIKKSKLFHGDKYDYSKSKYVDSITKINITCPDHGSFDQLPSNHMNGQGCSKCGNIKSKPKYTNLDFINKAKLIHGDRYDYSLVDYIDSKIKVDIICNEHGKFSQIAASHINGKGCLKCSNANKLTRYNSTKDEFILKAKDSHGDKYDYSLVDYINSHTKVKIICKLHGEFDQLPYDHIGNNGCSKCTSSVSKQEKEINDFIVLNGLITTTSSMSIIKPNQLDIYIPSHNLAIEYNGLYWHNELKLNNNYHLNKTELCEKQGIQLIHIFEDEWLNKQDIVKSRLKNILGLTENKIYGRKCIIKEVTTKECRIFMDNNHLQGYTNSSVKLGLYYNSELVSCMLFNKPRLGIGNKYDGYELTRFVSKLNTTVIGGADKLLNHFIKTYNPKQIISYADRRWSQGDLYQKLGFIETHKNKPNYWYIIGKYRKHRFNFRKTKLGKDGFDIINKTEHQIMLDREIYRIYDCGTITYSKTF